MKEITVHKITCDTCGKETSEEYNFLDYDNRDECLDCVIKRTAQESEKRIISLEKSLELEKNGLRLEIERLKRICGEK